MSRGPETGDELVAGAQAGSTESFVQLVMNYRPLLWRIAYRLSMNEEDARDICQEIMIRLWQRLSQYRNEQNFAGWLRTMAIREALRWLKRNRRARATVLYDNPRVKRDTKVQHAEIVRANLDKEEQREQLASAMKALSPQQRTAISLRHFEEMTVPEIAQAMGCSEGTVKQHLFRGMEKLREILKKRDE